MSSDQIRDYVAALLALIALAVVSWLAVIGKHEAAAGALIGLVNGASMWFLRGRVQPPSA